MLSSVFILFFCSENCRVSYDNAMARGKEGGKEPTCVVALQAKIDLVDNRLHSRQLNNLLSPLVIGGENYET